MLGSKSDLSCGCDGRKRICAVFQCEWVWVGVQKNSLSLDMAAAAARGTPVVSEKKKNCFGCRALPCPGQSSSGCEAGRPLELSLEGSLRPRHRGDVRGGKCHWAPEVSRTDCVLALSHLRIPTPCCVSSRSQPASQPTNQHFGHQPPLWGKSRRRWQADARNKTALFFYTILPLLQKTANIIIPQS